MSALTRRDLIGAASGLFTGAIIVGAARYVEVNELAQKVDAAQSDAESQREEFEATLLNSLPTPPENQAVLTTFTIQCLKGRVDGDQVAFCDDPSRDQGVALPSLASSP